MRQDLRKDFESTGFNAPAGHALGQERRTVALAALIATATLALSTIVVATVVSVGIAHANAIGANVVGNVIDNEGGLFALSLLLGVLFIGMGGLTILSLPGEKPKTRESSDHTPHHPTVA